MTLYLRPPSGCYGAKGQDGRGWNRLSLNAHMDDLSAQCALQPRTYQTLHDIRRDSRLCAWGYYGRCVGGGDCGSCPVRRREPPELCAFAPDVMVRLFGYPHQRPMLMEHPERGGDSTGYPIQWEVLAQLDARWKLGARFHDEVSEGFWLHWTGGHYRGVYGLNRVDAETTSEEVNPVDHVGANGQTHLKDR